MASKAFALFLAINLFVLGMPTDAITCPSNTLQITACVNALNLVKLQLGSTPVPDCCPLVAGLVSADAAACLCTLIKTSGILGTPLATLPVNISIILNGCGYPGTFSCY